MTFRQALFSFKGRMSRSDYWLKGATVLIPLSLFNNYLVYGVETRTALTVAMVIGILSLWPGLALLIKRLHDRDHSGWYAATLLIPLVNIVFALIIIVEVWFLKGTSGPNRFGEDPTDKAGIANLEAAPTNPLASVRSWSALFDKEKYGVIYLFVVFFALADVAVHLETYLLGILFAYHYPPMPWTYFLIQVLAATATGFILLVVFYLVRREALLPIFGGLTQVLVGICSALLLQQIQTEAAVFGSPFTVQRIFIQFLYGFLLVGALVMFVRRWGVTLKSLVLAAISAGLIFQFVLRVVVHRIFAIEPLFQIFIMSVATGAIYGSMIYAAFYLHFKTRQIEVAPQIDTRDTVDTSGAVNHGDDGAV